LARTKATIQQTRRSNERLVLRTIYDDGPISRADVARATGLTRTTVSDLVETLLAEGLVVEAGTGPSTGGKAPILLRVPPDARHLVGVDVDRDRLSGAIVDLHGEVKHRESRTLEGRDGAGALEDLDALVAGLTAAAERPLVGIGIGTPGLVDTADGMVRWAVGLDWHDVPLGPRVSDLTGLPTIVVNDSQAAAMAEWTFEQRSGSSDMVVVKVGEGIGAGIIIGGRLYTGEESGAGEIGHTRVVDEGLPCRCGSQGCLETVSSVRAVVDRAQTLAGAGIATASRSARVSYASLLAEYRVGDPLARDVVLASAEPLGRVLGAMLGTLGISDVVLIGPMTAFGDDWLGRVTREARRSALPILAQRSHIHLGRSGDEAVEIGAAAMLMTSELGLALAV
jgi:predicted NBD/HSP70 family sugar kinase/biotin operon repressor